MGFSRGNLTEECVGDGVFLYTLERGGVRVVFTNWGATLMSLCVPDAQGNAMRLANLPLCLVERRKILEEPISDVIVSW